MVKELSDSVTETQILHTKKTFKEIVAGENYL